MSQRNILIGVLVLVIGITLFLLRDKVFSSHGSNFYDFEGVIKSDIQYAKSSGYKMKCGSKDCGFLRTDCAPYIFKPEFGDRIFKEKNTMEFLLIKSDGKRHECEAR